MKIVLNHQAKAQFINTENFILNLLIMILVKKMNLKKVLKNIFDVFL